MGKKSPLQKLPLINFGSSKVLGSVYHLWQLQAELEGSGCGGVIKTAGTQGTGWAAGKGRSLCLRAVTLD